MNAVSRHAIDRTLRNGVTDELYIRYFGSAPASSVVGFYVSDSLNNILSDQSLIGWPDPTDVW